MRIFYRLTGTDPVTGQETFGYWYQGKYAVWQFLTIAHALGADWGEVGADGKMTINWNTPEYLKALEWFVEMSKYAPAGALAADAMPQGFLSDENVVAIIPEGEQGYFIQPLIAEQRHELDEVAFIERDQTAQRSGTNEALGNDVAVC